MCTGVLIIPNDTVWYIEYLVRWIRTRDWSPVIERDDPGTTVSSLQRRGTDGLGNRASGGSLWGKERGEVPSVESMRWKVRPAPPLECTHLHRPQKKSEVPEKRKLEAPMKISVHTWRDKSRRADSWVSGRESGHWQSRQAKPHLPSSTGQ